MQAGRQRAFNRDRGDPASKQEKRAPGKSEEELIAQRADRQIQARKAGAFALDHAPKARLYVVKEGGQLLASLELPHLAAERFRGVVPTDTRELREVVREAHLHQQRL